MAYKGFKGSGMNGAHKGKISNRDLARLANLYSQKMMLDFQRTAQEVAEKEEERFRK